MFSVVRTNSNNPSLSPKQCLEQIRFQIYNNQCHISVTALEEWDALPHCALRRFVVSGNQYTIHFSKVTAFYKRFSQHRISIYEWYNVFNTKQSWFIPRSTNLVIILRVLLVRMYIFLITHTHPYLADPIDETSGPTALGLANKI
jgi:hypothetical protein